MSGPDKLTLPFAEIDRAALPVAGGKAANLGELTRAGLPVPPGFCVTTSAYGLVAEGAGLDPTLDALAETPPGDASRLAELAATARAALLEARVPEDIGRAIADGYRELGGGAPVPVAVRSSATAEDLPGASFAGQQDTYLNVVGEAAVLEAVRRCWGSLWSERAVAYRRRLGIRPDGLAIAVVVQRMVRAAFAGVMINVEPIKGRRNEEVV